MATVTVPSRQPFRRALCAVAAGALLTAGCSLDTGGSGDASPEKSQGQGGPHEDRSGERAIDAVKDLTVAGRSPKTGYTREQFGDAWVDTDRNGCGTRDDVLRRDLRAETFRERRGNARCEVTSGTLDDPYTGKRLTFTRGGRSEVDIDHVVALSDAWQKGAQRWPRQRRIAFANDPLNLLAVEAAANRAKGDGDAATWLPPNTSFRCTYVARQAAVKSTYAVRVTRAERDAMLRVLDRCPDEPLPRAGQQPDVPVEPDEKESPGGGSAGSDGDGTDGGPDGGAYENCDAVRAAGKAPIHRGDPGYGRHLDRDGDGTGCDK